MVEGSAYTSIDAGDETGRRRPVSPGSSLQLRATVLVVSLTLCVAGGVSGYFLRSGFDLVRQHDRDQLQHTAAMVANNASAPWASGDFDELNHLAHDLANGMPLLYVVFTDIDGNELTSARARSAPPLSHARRFGPIALAALGTPLLHKSATGDGSLYLDIAYPVRATGRLTTANATESESNERELLGYVWAGQGADRWQQVMSSKLDLVVGVGTLATAIAVVLGFLVVRRIISPLEALAEMMLLFSRGRLDVRSKVNRRDEIGQLSSAFNRMADQHQQTHERIVRLNAELERRVAARTAQLRELAARDPLTGVYNRRHFAEMLERSFSEAQRYDHDLSCIMLDADDFKGVNDVHGHQVGDQLLLFIAETISHQLRTADVTARYGGDEFIALLPQTDAASARNLAERIQDAFGRNLSEKLEGVRVTLSMGIASIRSVDAPDADALIRGADRALYEAKGKGKNHVVVSGSQPRPAST